MHKVSLCALQPVRKHNNIPNRCEHAFLIKTKNLLLNENCLFKSVSANANAYLICSLVQAGPAGL